ncbi:dethiobiotin synthase [Rhodoplanes sp. TEM]|uniref:ATP-dependent dethiobiotin synthetase BioD n=1 Tax=Rhodoplanes tepidamans TaxID=200616 RepID=A0ABT5JAI2_RHOTP|nr:MULTISPECIES: dethiobiotin synthase [Rhodoplanes]MDC7786453.1 dethiobiotin synthase [Rhodoplanes tepidamans]MDC7985095.1 dethiobiotin synthase [Rhodoplanes sp. TEM]MDQ0357338.1 dethiobiotin synthetase [Rhodoplanes tepidamans]
MTVVFVSATGTEVGKTFVSRGLIRALKTKGRTVEALKPVQSGYDPREAEGSDAGLLIAATGAEPNEETIAAAAPWRFEAPLSPHLAARRENRSIDADAVIAFCRDRVAKKQDAMVIEGVGGIMAPLDETRTVLDLMVAVGAPVVLVAGSYLGTISHTLTALDVLARRGLGVLAVVVSQTADSSIPLDETASTLTTFAKGVPVLKLPRLPPESAPEHPVLDRLAAMV